MEDRFTTAIASVSRGVMIGTAFGDAFGIPYECKSFHEMALLRRCWIAQVLRHHPELVEFQHASSGGGSAEFDTASGGDGGGRGATGGSHHHESASEAALMNMPDVMDQKTASDDAGGNDAPSMPKQQVLPVPPRDPSKLAAFAYEAVSNHPLVPDGFPLGMWTDDTQLTCAMARALAKSLATSPSSSSSPRLSSDAATDDFATTGAALGLGQSARRPVRRERDRDRGDDDQLTTEAARSATDSATCEAQDALSKSGGHGGGSGGACGGASGGATTGLGGDSVSHRLRFYHIANEHVVEHQRSLAGWGGTRTAIERLIQPVEEMRAALARADASMLMMAPNLAGAPPSSNHNHQRHQQQQLVAAAASHSASPVSSFSSSSAGPGGAVSMDSFAAHRFSGNQQAVGNGVLMKLTPLSLVFGVEQALLNRQTAGLSLDDKRRQQMLRILSRERLVVELCRMTHGSGDAIATAIVHNEMLSSVFEDWFASCVLGAKLGRPHRQHGGDADAGVSQSSSAAAAGASQSCIGIDAVEVADDCATDPRSPRSAPLRSQQQRKQGGGAGDSGGGGGSGNGRNRASPLFERVQSSNKRAALVAAMFHVALERGIAFCSQMCESASSASSAASSATGENTANSLDCRFPDSFARIEAALRKVRAFFADLERRHQDLGEEEWLQGDLFPFVSRSEREEIERHIVAISDGGTYHCISSFTFVWAYLAAFAPCCAASCARADIVPTAIAHSALLGGDTDSNAAMIGGVLGGIFGATSIEPHVAAVPHIEIINEAVRCLECSMTALVNGPAEQK